MATVKISVRALASEKAVFSSAAKNAREVAEVIKKTQASIGNDRMFDEAKRSLFRLSELIDKRARALEALANALGSASASYGNAQAKGVRVVSELRAHKTDFYGKPVHVSAAAGSAAGIASGTASAPSAEPLVYVSGSTQPAQGTVSGNTVIDNHIENYVYNNYANEAPASVLSSDTSGPVSSSAVTLNTAGTAAPSVPADTSGTIPVSSMYSGSEPLSSYNSAAFPQDISSGAAAFETAQDPFSSVSEVQNGDMTAAVITGGIAGAAAIAGAAVGLADMIKQDREKKKIDEQIKEAKKKLRQIEDEQSEMTAAASVTDTETSDED